MCSGKCVYFKLCRLKIIYWVIALCASDSRYQTCVIRKREIISSIDYQLFEIHWRNYILPRILASTMAIPGREGLQGSQHPPKFISAYSGPFA